jgi:hypothetical protein
MQKLKMIVEVLEPFECITDKLQGENNATIGLVAPSVFSLLKHLDDIDSRAAGLWHFCKFHLSMYFILYQLYLFLYISKIFKLFKLNHTCFFMLTLLSIFN